MATTYARIQPRRKTAAQWISSNEVLLDGEIGYETDTKKSKRGDATTAWTALPYEAPDSTTLAATYQSFGTGAATGDGTTDDSTTLAAALAAGAGKTITLVPGKTYVAGSLTIPAHTTVIGYGVKVKPASGTAAALTLSAGTKVHGLEIDGSNLTGSGAHGIVLGGPDAAVRGCYIHNVPGAGVQTADGTVSRYLITGNRIENVAGQAINLNYSSRGAIADNEIDTALHGIQWWGGDSAASTTIGIEHLRITGNHVRNVHGGIWGSLGRHITVTGNTVLNCSDVGIDFEGCQDSTATGNTVTDCTASALSVFYGSKRVSFTGNDVYQSAGKGHGFHAYGSTASTSISLVGNRITTAGTVGVYSDQSMLTDSVISDNTIDVGTGIESIRLIGACDRNVIAGNKITCTNPTGISLEGGSSCDITGNSLRYIGTDTSTAAMTFGGIYVYRQSGSAPGQHNRVRGNRVEGFVVGVCDSNGGDFASRNLIIDNQAELITHYGLNGYYGFIEGNRIAGDPSTLTPIRRF